MFTFSEADMELGSSLADIASLRVVLVPVGKISEKSFEELAGLVTRISDVPLRALPRRLLEDKETTAKISRASSPAIPAASKLRKSFASGESFTNLKNVMGSPDANSLAEEDVDEVVRIRYELLRPDENHNFVVPQPSEWEGFRASRRVWGVVGIADMRDSQSLDSESDATEAFQAARRDFFNVLAQYRSLTVSRCLAFTSLEAVSKPGMRVFLSSIEELQREGSAEGHVPMQTTGPILSPLDMKHSVENQSKLKHRRQGRLDKCAGDLYLLMACPSLAQAKYESAVEKARTHNDRLWLASSLEGLSAAMLTKNGDQDNVEAIIDQSTETYKLYGKKRLVELEVAAIMRVATFLSELPKHRREALETAQHAAQTGESLRPTKKRVALLSYLVRLMCDIKAHRKAALFLYQLGSLYRGSRRWKESYDASIEVTKLLQRDYGSSQLLGSPAEGWAGLRRAVLFEAAGAAAQMSDEKRRSICLINALNLSPHLLAEASGESDEEIVVQLNRLTDPVAEIESSTSQLLSFVGVDTMKTSALVHDRTYKEKVPKTGPFIFSAIAEGREKVEDVATWIQGESTILAVTFESFLRADMDIRIVALLVRPLEERQTNRNAAASFVPRISVAEEMRRSRQLVRTCPTAVTIPPMTRTEISSRLQTGIECTPLQQGTFEVAGAVAQVFGGSLLRLALSQKVKRAAIKVFPPLSVVDLSFEMLKGHTSIVAPTEHVVFHLLNGEVQKLRVQVRNVGSVAIHRVAMQLVASDEAKRLLSMDEKDAKIDFENVPVGETRCMEVSFTTAGGKEGTACLDCIVEHSPVTCGTIYRESCRSITIHTGSAVELANVNLLRLPDGEVAAALELHNTMTTLLHIRAETTEEFDNSLELESLRALNETVVDPLRTAVLVLRIPSGEKGLALVHSATLHFVVHWTALTSGNRGTVSFDVKPADDLSVLSRPSLRMKLYIDNVLLKDCVDPIKTGRFHDVRVVIVQGDEELCRSGEPGILSVKVCQEDGYGERNEITDASMVSCVGIQTGVKCSLLTGFEHEFKARFDSAGQFGVEASIHGEGWTFKRFWRLRLGE